MATTTTVNCPRGVYTQVTTATDAYCIISSPIDARQRGQKLRVHIGAAAPAPTTSAYHLVEKDEAFERPSELSGHIFVLPEIQDTDLPVTEAV
jgi:hypothetical protein